VVQRLYEEADRRALKQAQAKAAVERAAGSAFTFKPAINSASETIARTRKTKKADAEEEVAF
jgi:hypothetical protein